MKKYFYAIGMAAALLLSGCSKYEFHGYPSASYFAVVNESSHDIRIFWFVGKPNTSEGFLNTIPYLPDETKLSPRESETYEYHYNYFNEDGLQPPMMMFKGQAFIVYDNEIVYRARYGKEGDYHNLLDNSTY